MKNNELRVGNLVLFYEDIVSITGIVKSGFYFGKNDFAINLLEWFQPIQLTEEWLLKFGFKLDMENFNWNAAIGENGIGDFKLALRYSERIGWFFQSKCTVLKYVHQLQNLYFAICGEELFFSTEP